MRKFVTIFQDVENIHLIKDVGMIPYGMFKYYGYDSYIVLPPQKKYQYLETEVKGLKADYTENMFKRQGINCLIWLLKNAKQIDVLCLFHHNLASTKCLVGLYKRLNKRGLVYIHCDSGEIDYSKFEIPTGKIKRKLDEVLFYPEHIRRDILFGVQCKDAVMEIKGKYPFTNVAYVPDGYDIPAECVIKNYEERSNTILSVGRLGTQQKRTDILLEGFRKSELFKTGWKLKCIGTIENSFKEWLLKWYRKYPEMKKFVEFVGPLADRTKLANLYYETKIFCLPSDYESFGIVMVEALSCGNALVITPYNAAMDILRSGDYGEYFSFGDAEDLSEKLRRLANDEGRLKKICLNGQFFAKSNYSYKNILRDIDEWIREKNNE